jgi:hypothetical protein
VKPSRNSGFRGLVLVRPGRNGCFREASGDRQEQLYPEGSGKAGLVYTGSQRGGQNGNPGSLSVREESFGPIIYVRARNEKADCPFRRKSDNAKGPSRNNLCTRSLTVAAPSRFPSRAREQAEGDHCQGYFVTGPKVPPLCAPHRFREVAGFRRRSRIESLTIVLIAASP